MHGDEEQAFQSAQKDLDLQIIDYRSSKLVHTQKYLTRRANSEHVSWKFTAMPLSSPLPTQPQPPSNISFQTEQYNSTSENQQSDDQENGESYLARKYQASEEIYKKKFGFGTNWVGRRQYYASIFVNPSRFEKQNLQYFVDSCPFIELGPTPNSCTFDSEFQCGNLLNAFKVAPMEYDLILQNDINTKGNTQWFYFRIRGIPKDQPLQINIVNLRKSDSLFNYGLLPCIYSFEEQRRSKRGWFRAGTQVRYFRNTHQVENSRRFYYTLSFTLKSRYEGDTLLVAHSYPYGVSDLNRYIQGLEAVKYKQQLMQRQTICNTIGKNKVQAISISDGSPRKKTKPLIFVLARQHPGQTPASFVCEGFVNFLLSKQRQSEYLRKNYETIVIPMVNPDGVAAGNYRTNLFGEDLNRRWEGGQRRNPLHQASIIKKYLRQVAKNRSIALVLDLHGHSRKLFSFFYGNPSPGNLVQSRIYPYLCCKLAPSFIRFEDSTFLIEEAKRNTARVQLGLTFQTPNIYTYEVSFYGYFGRDKEPKHFTAEGMRDLGQTLCKGLYLHERGKELLQKSPDHKEAGLYKRCLWELRSNAALISVGQQYHSGSESSPEDCELKEQEQQQLEQDSEYLCDKTTSKVKLMKKVYKKDPQVKQMARTSRQMQVLDIAQVYSAFPNNIIALIPNSYLQKIKRNPMIQAGVQTDAFPLIRIYESCKQQELCSTSGPVTSANVPSEDLFIDKGKTSNLIRSTILSRPRSTKLTSQTSEYGRLSQKSQPKNANSVKPQTCFSAKKSHSTVSKRKFQEKAVQTTLTFAKWSRSPYPNEPQPSEHSNLNTISSSKFKLTQEAEILVYKSVEASYCSREPKGKPEAGTIGKVITKNLLQSLRTRKRK